MKYIAGFVHGLIFTGSWFWWILAGADTKNNIFALPIVLTFLTLFWLFIWVAVNWDTFD